jgi:linearmycin/streptolysin S transport system permease protein
MLSIAWKDLLILFKDRNAMIGAFLLPIVFVVVYLGVAGAAGGGRSDGGNNDSGTGATRRMPLVVVNNDTAGATALALIDGLGRADIAVTEYPEADARAKLAAKEIERILVIPAGFSGSVAAGKPVSLVLENNSLDPGTNEAVRMTVAGVTSQMSLERQIVASLQRLGDMQRANPSFDPATSAALAIPIAERQFEASRDRPLVTAARSQPASLGQGEQVVISGVQIGVPGFAVLFIFLTAQITARSIYDEKKTGTFRRLMAAPLGKWRMLVGKLIPNFVVVVLQVVVMFAAGMFLLPLIGLDALRLGKDPVALVLLVLSIALCCTTLGILIAAVARTEAQIGGIAALVLWVLAFLGGSFIPLFLINESMATIGQVTPHYWAVTGFYDLLTRGQGLAAVLDSIVVLLGFSAVFFVIGAWRFEFE